MFKAMENALSAFTKKPVSFIYGSFLAFFLNLVTAGGLLGLLLIIYYTLSTFEVLNGNIIPIAIILTIISIVYLVIVNGLKGALINTYYRLTQGKKPELDYFVRYSLGNGELFFLITVIKTLITAVMIAPGILIYVYILREMAIPYMKEIGYFLVAGILFLIEFPFSFAYISAATTGSGIVQSIKNGFKFIFKNHIKALTLFFIYAFIWLFFLIPDLMISLSLAMGYSTLVTAFLALVAIGIYLITLLITYPIVYTSLILFYNNRK